MSKNHSLLSRSMRRHAQAGMAGVILLVGGVGGWAATTEISGAVVASGNLVVDSSVKKVQHAAGGTIGEIRVRNGDPVKGGDVVVRLDPTVTRANLGIVSKGLDLLVARRCRLEAERDGLHSIAFPAEPATRHSLNFEAAMAGETRLFDARKTARTNQKAQLTERVLQLRQEIEGVELQRRSKDHEVQLVDKELAGVRTLWVKKLVDINRVTGLERESVRLSGERGKLMSDLAQTRGRIAEIELQISQIDQDLLTEVNKELRETESKIAENEERQVAAQDQLERMDIRAPLSGVVHQLAVHTVGGVISPGETLMMIVPEADRLLVEAKVSPREIDRIHVGQKANLRFTSFNQRTTPVVEGAVAFVSADVNADERSGEHYYNVRINLDLRQVAHLGAERIVPGMPVEVYLEAEERTVLSFLTKPLFDQVARTFRER